VYLPDSQLDRNIEDRKMEMTHGNEIICGLPGEVLWKRKLHALQKTANVMGRSDLLDIVASGRQYSPAVNEDSIS